MKITDITTQPGTICYNKYRICPHGLETTIAEYILKEAPVYYDGEQPHGLDDIGEVENMHCGMTSFGKTPVKIDGYLWMWGKAIDDSITFVLVDTKSDKTIAYVNCIVHTQFRPGDDALELTRAWISPDVRGSGLISQMILHMHKMGFVLISGDSVSTPARKMFDNIKTKIEQQGGAIRNYNIKTKQYVSSDDYIPNVADIRYVIEAHDTSWTTHSVILETLF